MTRGPSLRGRVDQVDHVRTFLSDDALSNSDRKELRFWKGDPRYNPQSSLWENLKVKAGELRMFEELIPTLAPRAGERILELGAGHGWASLMLKRQRPDCEVHASDVSADALLGAEKWERLLEARLDGYWACQADHTPFEDDQFDLVFTFAAFHHFAIGNRGRAALTESLRILKRSGRLVLLSEPCAPFWLRTWSKRKLDRIRRDSGFDIEEDVLVPAELRRWAGEHGARMHVRFDTSWSWREIQLQGVLRNAAVRVFPPLGWWVPIGAHITFTRRG